MRLAWLLILRTLRTLNLGGGDGRAVVWVLVTEYFWEHFVSIFCSYSSAPAVRSYLRRERLMIIVGNWNPRVLRFFCSSSFPFRAAPKQVLVFWERVSRTFATAY